MSRLTANELRYLDCQTLDELAKRDRSAADSFLQDAAAAASSFMSCYSILVDPPSFSYTDEEQDRAVSYDPFTDTATLYASDDTPLLQPLVDGLLAKYEVEQHLDRIGDQCWEDVETLAGDTIDSETACQYASILDGNDPLQGIVRTAGAEYRITREEQHENASNLFKLLEDTCQPCDSIQDYEGMVPTGDWLDTAPETIMHGIAEGSVHDEQLVHRIATWHPGKDSDDAAQAIGQIETHRDQIIEHEGQLASLEDRLRGALEQEHHEHQSETDPRLQAFSVFTRQYGHGNMQTPEGLPDDVLEHFNHFRELKPAVDRLLERRKE